MRTNIQPKDSALTYEKADEILKDHGAVTIQDHEGSCECGTTSARVGYDQKFKQIGFVLVCDSCGDDDGFDLFNS